jgi:hypothetical protein
VPKDREKTIPEERKTPKKNQVLPDEKEEEEVNMFF